MTAFNPATDEYEPDDESYCETCGTELEWEDCHECGGEGFYHHEGDAEEPWDSLEACELCQGRGGWLVCPRIPHPEQEPSG